MGAIKRPQIINILGKQSQENGFKPAFFHKIQNVSKNWQKCWQINNLKGIFCSVLPFPASHVTCARLVISTFIDVPGLCFLDFYNRGKCHRHPKCFKLHYELAFEFPLDVIYLYLLKSKPFPPSPQPLSRLSTMNLLS